MAYRPVRHPDSRRSRKRTAHSLLARRAPQGPGGGRAHLHRRAIALPERRGYPLQLHRRKHRRSGPAGNLPRRLRPADLLHRRGHAAHKGRRLVRRRPVGTAAPAHLEQRPRGAEERLAVPLQGHHALQPLHGEAAPIQPPAHQQPVRGAEGRSARPQGHLLLVSHRPFRPRAAGHQHGDVDAAGEAVEPRRSIRLHRQRATADAATTQLRKQRGAR